jgi:cytochrome c oxidase subunit II
MDAPGRTSDSLGIVYVASALVFCAAALLVVVALFLPSDFLDRRDPSQLYIPGTPPEWGGFVDPLAVEANGVREIGPGRYQVTMEAYNWSFDPAEIRVPAGSEVTFRIRSTEDHHGLAIAGTSVLINLAPNDLQEVTHTFEDPGEYLFVCSEYCGGGHAYMLGAIRVE